MRADSDRECVDPSAPDDDPTACPIGEVPTASPDMPLRHRVSLGVKALASLVRYIEDLRRVRRSSAVD